MIARTHPERFGCAAVFLLSFQLSQEAESVAKWHVLLCERPTFSQIVKGSTGNTKLGPGWACTYRPVGPTCPSDCPLMGKGCYAQRGRVKISAVRSKVRSDSLAGLIGAPLVRHLVSGDILDESGRVDRDYWQHVCAFHRVSDRSVGLLYTHAADRLTKRDREIIPENLHVLASCDSEAKADELQASGWRTARVTERKAKRSGEVFCPVDLAKHAGKPVKANCSSCRLCFESPSNIVFLKF